MVWPVRAQMLVGVENPGPHVGVHHLPEPAGARRGPHPSPRLTQPHHLPQAQVLL